MSEANSDELALVRRAATDPEAFGELYERHVRRIYNYIYYRTGDHHDAEDLTARVFQRALRHVGSFQDKGVPFTAWLYRIAHNLVANWHRDQSNRRTFSLDGPVQVPEVTDDNEDVHDKTTEREDARELRAALSRLPADRQQLIMLKYVAGLTNAEIGAAMGKSEGAVKALLHRTLLSLRSDLAPAVTASESGPATRR